AGATSGNVVVTVGGLASNALTYTVTVAPTLTSLSPSSGPVGTAVTITGSNFGASQGASTVTFNGAAATPTSWSAPSITAPAPARGSHRNGGRAGGGPREQRPHLPRGRGTPAYQPLAGERPCRHRGHDQR